MAFNLKEDWEKFVMEQLSQPHHLKDFGKLKTDLERFRFCRRILSDEPKAQNLIQTAQKVLNKRRSIPGKSLEKVQQFVAAGDDCCIKKQFRKAVSYYSKSIQYFPCQRNSSLSKHNEHPSLNSEPTLAGVLTRRAEALFTVGEYEACLNDIREASSLQYNHTLGDRLLKVEKACLKKQDRQSRASTGSSVSSNIPELAGGEHDKIASGSKLIAINHDAKQGRFLQACEEIRAGDALIAEKPFAAVLLPENAESYCDNCFRPLVAPYSCRKCCSVLYCSSSCRDKAWMEYHSVECSLYPVLEMLDTFAHLSLRVLLAAGPDQILKVLQETCTLDGDTEPSPGKVSSVPGCTSSGAYPGDYSSVFSLVTNTELQPVKALLSYSLNSALLMEFLEDAVSLPKSQRLRSQENGKNCTESGQNELDSDDDSVNSCDACEQERTVDVHSNKRSHSESSDDLGFKNGPMRSVPRCGKTCDSLGLYHEEFTNTLSEEIVGSLLLHHQQQMPCNVHAITMIVSTSSSDEENDEDCNGVGAHQGQVISREQRRIATAIYPTGSLLNHACDPDVIVSFVDGVLVVRATHNISPGSAITHCYGPHASRMPREERQKLLFKQYFFTCQCSACTRDEEMENKLLCFSAFACQNCKGAMKPSIVDATMGRCQNKDCKQEKSLEDELKLAREAELFFFKGIRLLERVGVHGALEVLRECLRIRKQILHQYNKDLAETHDAIARCYAMIGDFKKATHHCLQSSEAVEKAYGSSSVEYGHELHKLSQLLFNDRQVKKALAMIDKAIGLLGTHYGRSHPDVKELGEMKKCLTAVSGRGNQFL